jgi:hypothetical protein
MSLEEFTEEERELYGEGTNEERERSRALMWDVPRYLEAMLRREGRPVLAGVVENVVEARAWYRWHEWRDAAGHTQEAADLAARVARAFVPNSPST